MTLAVRFRYYTATTPSFDIVELNDKQWREFFLLERSHRLRRTCIMAGRGCSWIAVYFKSGQYYCPVKEEKRK